MRADHGDVAGGAGGEDLEGSSPGAAATDSSVLHTTNLDASSSGYCLWEFDGEIWVIKKDRSREGHVPSAPPSSPGRFRGQLRAVMSVRVTIVGGDRP